MRKSDWYLAFLGLSLLAIVLASAHSHYKADCLSKAVEGKAALVGELGLTDLCLFTEARYTRNPSVSDLSTAFQDHPVSLEHFPSGSFIGPPAHLVKGANDVARE